MQNKGAFMIEIIPNWHPLLVHFTVALLAVAVIGFLLAHLFPGWRRSNEIMKVARWNFWLGSLSAVGTVLAGWYAFNTVNHDTPSHAAMIVHRNWALATTAVILVLDMWFWRVRRTHQGRITHPFGLALVVFFMMLGTTAWHGGELVYRYGLGVMSLPTVEGDGHEHVNSEDLHRGTFKEGIDAKHTMPEASHHEEMYENRLQEENENIPANDIPANDGEAVDASADPKYRAIPSGAMLSPDPSAQVHDDGHQHAH